MPVLYNSNCLFEDSQGIKYSCDMLRIQGLLSDDGYTIEEFNAYFRDETNIRISDTAVNTAIGKYKFLWNISCLHTTITVLHCFNGYTNSKDDNRRVVIEFNPNKMVYDDYNEIHKVLRCLVEVSVVRCDLACDIPVGRDFCHLLKDKRNYQYCDFNESGITEYLGVRNNTNFVKLYDKTKESKLDTPATRLEITCKPQMIEFKKIIPKVIVEKGQFELELMSYDNISKSQLATIKVLQGLDVNTRVKALKSFSYRQRKKLSPYVLADTYELKLDSKCVNAVFQWINNAIYNRSFTMTS